MNSADLTRELRATRPVAGDALRERVRAIAATQPKRRPSPFARFSPRRLVLVAVPAAAVIVAAVAGVTALVDSEQGQRLADTPLASESATVAQDSALAPVEKAAAGGAAATTTAPAPAQDRAQRYSAQLTIAVKDNDALSKATQSALATARRLGGYVVSVQYATAETGAASMTLRVPTARVQDALVSLSGLGTIEAQQVQIDDLQGQVDELGKREAALRERIARLSARIAAPGTRRRDEGDARRTPRRRTQRARAGARAEHAGDRRGPLRDDPAAAADRAGVGRTAGALALRRRARPGVARPRVGGGRRALRARRRRAGRPRRPRSRGSRGGSSGAARTSGCCRRTDDGREAGLAATERRPGWR